MVCNLTAVLQDLRAGRIGVGHVMAMGASGTFSPHNHGAWPTRLRRTWGASNIAWNDLSPGHSLFDRPGQVYDSYGRETYLVLRFAY